MRGICCVLLQRYADPLSVKLKSVNTSAVNADGVPVDATRPQQAPEIWECGGSLSRLRSFDRGVDRHDAPRHLGMQPLDHAALDLQHALIFVFR